MRAKRAARTPFAVRCFIVAICAALLYAVLVDFATVRGVRSFLETLFALTLAVALVIVLLAGVNLLPARRATEDPLAAIRRADAARVLREDAEGPGAGH